VAITTNAAVLCALFATLSFGRCFADRRRRRRRRRQLALSVVAGPAVTLAAEGGYACRYAARG
jgi:hypothetical protein